MTTKPTTRSYVLAEAAKAVASRGRNYGGPKANFSQIASLANELLRDKLRSDLTPEDIAQMMILLKLSRLRHSPGHLDSWIDIAGYAACGAEITVEKAP